MKKLICTISLAFLGMAGFCQSYTSINYSLSEGLPSNEAYEVFQDKQGFLWFATDNGVVKYDGYEMVRLGVEDGLTDPVVFGFHQDQKNRIWFRTFSGKLCYYEDGRVHPYIYNNRLAPLITRSIVSAIHVDSADNLWFSTFRHRGVHGKISSKGEVTAFYPDSALLYYKDIGEAALFGYQQIEKPFALVNEKWNHLPELVFNEGGCEIYTMLPVRWHGKLYLAACSNIYRVDDDSMVRVFHGRGPIISLSKDKDENLWVGYMSYGVERFATPAFKPLAVPDFLSRITVSKVFKDNHDGLWFSTLERGLYHVPNIAIENFELANNHKVRFVGSSGPDVYIATSEGEILRVSNNSPAQVVQQFSPPLKGLYVDRNRKIWVTAARTTYRLDAATAKIEEDMWHSLSNAAEDKEGNLFMVSGGALIAKLPAGSQQIKMSQLPFMCRNLFIQDTTLYIVTRSGLHTADLNLTKTREIPSLADFKINKILKLNDSTLLLTTIGRGFIVFDINTHRFKNYNTANNFVANNIFAAVIKDDYIWFGTENGLIRLDKTSLSTSLLRFQQLTKQNGLISTLITNVAFVDDVIWAFSDIGYSKIRLDALQFFEQPPSFYLKELRVNNEPIDLTTSAIELPYDRNNILINFGFISLNKEKIFTRHRLKPTDRWNYSTARSLQFYSLAPADYQIQIEYSFDNTNWHRGFMSPRIVIAQPFYKTWYFLAGGSATIILLIFLFFRNQMIVYRRHQQRLIQSEIQTIERERTRIAKDLHDSVGTDFSAIKMMVSQILRKYQEPQADAIESQFQNSIQEIKSIIYGLSPPGLERYGLMTALTTYVNRLNGNVNAEITINTFGEEIKNRTLNISVFRIIQELISNSLKHADAKTISIHMNSFEDLLNIVYEDDGKGFEWNNNRNGAGLFNIESRVQAVNGSLRFESNQYGVSYTIDIPLQKEQMVSK